RVSHNPACRHFVVRPARIKGIIEKMFFGLVNISGNILQSSKRKVISAAAFLLLIAFSCASCKSGYPVSAKNSPNIEPRQVKIVAVSQVMMERTVTVTGTLAAYDQATVSAKVPGRLGTISVDLGSVV